MEYALIILSAIFVNNVVLSQIPGVYPLQGTNTNTKTSLIIGIAIFLVTTLATTVSFLLNQYVLIPLNIPFLQTISYILIITVLVQLLEMILKKAKLSLYQTMNISFPLLTIDCAVMGIAILVFKKNFNMVELVAFAAASALGYALVLVILSSIREQLKLAEMPDAMAGIPIALITAGLLALAFMGFAGLG